MRRMLCTVIAALLLCLLSGCGGGVAPGIGETEAVEVPDVCGVTFEKAQSVLNEAGFASVSSDRDKEKIPPDRLVVLAQNPAAGSIAVPSKKVTLTCAKRCQVYFDLSSENNLLLHTYDLEICVDAQNIATVHNGERFTLLSEMMEGHYTLYAYKAGDHDVGASQTLNVSDDMTFSATMLHGGSVSFSDVKITNGVALSALEVPDLTGKVLSEAKDALARLGFANVREEPYAKIWNSSNWIVTGQGLAAGSVASNNEQLTLDCILLDDYFNSAYVGKTLAEVQALAKEQGFPLKPEDAEDDKDLSLASMVWSEEEKTAWIVKQARQGLGKTAVITVERLTPSPMPASEPVVVPVSEPIAAPEQTPVPTPEPTPEPTPIPTPEPKPTPTAEPVSLPEADSEPTPIPEEYYGIRLYTKDLKVRTGRNLSHVSEGITLGNDETAWITVDIPYKDITYDDLLIVFDESLLKVEFKEPVSDSEGTHFVLIVTGIKECMTTIDIAAYYEYYIAAMEEEEYNYFQMYVHKLNAFDGRRVYYTFSGTKYHLKKECAGENWRETTYYDARAMDLEPCKKCAQ